MRALENPLCSLGVWVAKRRPALAGLTPHPSSPLLQAPRGTRDLCQLSNCPCCSPSQKLERALQSMCTAVAYAIIECCGGLWNIWKRGDGKGQGLEPVVYPAQPNQLHAGAEAAWNMLAKRQPPFSQYQSLTATSRAC